VKESYEVTLKLLKTLHNKSDIKTLFVDLPVLERILHVIKYPYLNEIKYSRLNVQGLKERDVYMAKKAEEIRLKDGASQVLLVGFKHYGIGEILASKGFNVKLFSVFSNRPATKEEIDPSLPEAEIEDLLYTPNIRNFTKNEWKKEAEILEDLVLLDLHKYPDLAENYTQIIDDELDDITNLDEYSVGLVAIDYSQSYPETEL
jgi:hypothetical protein